MTTYTLQLVPSGYKVVPEEPTISMGSAAGIAWLEYGNNAAQIRAAIKAAPHLKTPPVLRWENGELMVYGAALAEVKEEKYLSFTHRWVVPSLGISGWHRSEQEARRAAEKALWFPDELIIEEV